MSTAFTWEQIRRDALEWRPRLFEEVLNLDIDNLPYIGHLITRTAIEAGYVAKRANLKGNTILEWSRSSQLDGRGAPNQWACFAAVDLLIEKGPTPDSSDDKLWCCLAYYWYLAHGPFATAEQAIDALPERFRSQPMLQALNVVHDHAKLKAGD
jgi:hypothetical protein